MAQTSRAARIQAWSAYLAASLVLVVAYPFLPARAQNFAYLAFGVGALAAILTGVAAGRLPRPGWSLVAAGIATLTVADGLYTWVFDERFPTVADALYLASYPLLIWGIALLVRRGRGGGGSLLDATILAVPLTLGLWAAVIEPLASDGTEPVLSRIVSSAYPLGDAAMLAFLLALLLRPARRLPAYWLLAGAVVGLIVSDLAYDELLAYGTYVQGTWVDCGWLAMYALVGAAALHPSASRLAEPSPVGDALSARRLVLLGGAAVASAALVLVTWARGPLGLPVVALAAVVVPLLILARLAMLAREQRQSAERARHLAALVASTDDAVIATDLAGVVTNWNAAAERILGFSSDEAVGRTIWDLSAVGGREMSMAVHDRVVLTQQVERFEATRRRKDGRDVEVSITLSPIRDERGRIVGVSGITRDVTDQRRLESQLRAAQRMEAVGQLAGGVAHDFNNLMTAVLGHADMIDASLDADDERRKHVERITYAAGRAAELTRHLLAFSRRQVLREATLDLNRVVGGLVDLAQAWDGEEVVLDLEPELGAVKADPREVERVLANLVANARDAMPQGGTLKVSTRNAELDEAFVERHPGSRTGPVVELTVADTGRGIDPVAVDRVFEPFFTTKPTGATTGAGLGLSTVYGIVKQSHGYITVESEPGEGSVFRVFLPRVECRPAASDDERGQAPGPASVLLVEDELVVRELVRDMLAHVGFNVRATGNPEHALELAAHSDPIDLVITDLVMPGMNGHRLAERLEEIRPGTPVLFTSGYPGEDVVRDGVLGIGRRFLPKPFTAIELETAARSLLAAGETA